MNNYNNSNSGYAGERPRRRNRADLSMDTSKYLEINQQTQKTNIETYRIARRFVLTQEIGQKFYSELFPEDDVYSAAANQALDEELRCNQEESTDHEYSREAGLGIPTRHYAINHREEENQQLQGYNVAGAFGHQTPQTPNMTPIQQEAETRRKEAEANRLKESKYRAYIASIRSACVTTVMFINATIGPNIQRRVEEPTTPWAMAVMNNDLRRLRYIIMTEYANTAPNPMAEYVGAFKEMMDIQEQSTDIRETRTKQESLYYRLETLRKQVHQLNNTGTKTALDAILMQVQLSAYKHPTLKKEIARVTQEENQPLV